MKAIGYVRVSTAHQVTDGVSLDAQEHRIRAWCEASDYELLAIYRDEGISGSKADNRPGLQTALNAACKHKAALIVFNLSRLARSTKDAIDISERLEKCGADLVSLSEKIDTSSAGGRLFFKLMAALAEFERDQVSERTRAAMAHKQGLGQRVGAVPYGYTLGRDGTSLEVDPSEMAVIERIQELRSSGRTLRDIASALNTDGITTKQGKEWAPQTVSLILKRKQMPAAEGTDVGEHVSSRDGLTSTR